MKVSVILIFILVIASLGLAQTTYNKPFDLRDYKRVEVKDKVTGYTIPYLQLKTTPILNRPRTLDTQDVSVHEWYYLERVGQLPWYYNMVCGDANHDDLGEIYGSVRPSLYRDEYLSQWVFNHYDYNRPGLMVDLSNPINDSLSDLLFLDSAGVAIMTSRSYNDYPDTTSWRWLSPSNEIYYAKFSDMDGDDIGEVSFIYDFYVGYRMYENTGGNQYTYKTAIPFFQHVLDYFGEPSWGDINNDGQNEIFAGGIHGEIVVFNNVANDSFEFSQNVQMGTPNAYSTEFLGDLDDDGQNEFMVGANGANYINKIWSSDGGNSYRVEFTNSQPGAFGDYSDIEIGNYWGQDSQIVICSNNSLSIIRSSGINRWQMALKFNTGSDYTIARAFNTGDYPHTVILNTVYTPQSLTWIYRVKGTYIPGDVNNDGRISGSDVLYLVAVLKNGGRTIQEPYWRADANGDCEVGWADVSFLVSYLKGLGFAPEPGWCNLYSVGN
jgi:hypothetical protein